MAGLKVYDVVRDPDGRVGMVTAIVGSTAKVKLETGGTFVYTIGRLELLVSAPTGGES
jgi:hypothetical protein